MQIYGMQILLQCAWNVKPKSNDAKQLTATAVALISASDLNGGGGFKLPLAHKLCVAQTHWPAFAQDGRLNPFYLAPCLHLTS